MKQSTSVAYWLYCLNNIQTARSCRRHPWTTHHLLYELANPIRMRAINEAINDNPALTVEAFYLGALVSLVSISVHMCVATERSGR